MMDEIVNAIAADVRQRFAQLSREDRQRPVGEKRLDIDVYNEAERDRPIDDGEMVLHGKRVHWVGTRWAVWRVRWTGKEWRRYLRISGPLKYSQALDRLSAECKRLHMERVL